MNKQKYIFIILLLSFFACNRQTKKGIEPNEKKIDTIKVKYVDFYRPGPNWKLEGKNEKQETEYIYIESNNKIIPKKLFPNNSFELFGNFKKEKGIPKKYEKSEQKLKNGRIFVYNGFKTIPDYKEKDHSIKKKLCDKPISLRELDQEDFDVDYQNKVIVIKELLYDNLQGKTIKIPLENKKIKAKIKFTFGILQHLTDNSPSSPLKFSKETKFIDLPIKNNTISIPEMGNNCPSIKDIYEFFGFENNDSLKKWINGNGIELMKLSIAKQKKYYSEILKNQDNYKKCCPEYLKQAKKLMAKKNFKIKELNIGYFVKKIEIVFVGNNLKYRKIIIKKGDS